MNVIAFITNNETLKLEISKLLGPETIAILRIKNR